LREREDCEAKVRELFYNRQVVLFEQLPNFLGAEVVNVTTTLLEIVITKHPALQQTV
jgi:hypothetical protein